LASRLPSIVKAEQEINSSGSDISRKYCQHRQQGEAGMSPYCPAHAPTGIALDRFQARRNRQASV
jgi:hypothetical protein